MTIELSGLYIRGVFNWWEAQPRYLLNQGQQRWYVDVELIADGQPYDFKFSDSKWTPSQTCGSLGNNNALVPTNSVTLLTCGSEAQNLQFIPKKTGTYRFTLEKESDKEVILRITNTQR
jgi:hypothetical protein